MLNDVERCYCKKIIVKFKLLLYGYIHSFCRIIHSKHYERSTMATKPIRADMLAVEDPRNGNLYVHLRLSTEINDSLRRSIIRKPSVQSARFQIDPKSLNLNQLIIRIHPNYSYVDASDEIITALRRWHEIECGWLNCLPVLRIARVIEQNHLQYEYFHPAETSVGVQLGRVIAKKQWAMLKGNWLLMWRTAQEEFQLRSQLV